MLFHVEIVDNCNNGSRYHVFLFAVVDELRLVSAHIEDTYLFRGAASPFLRSALIVDSFPEEPDIDFLHVFVIEHLFTAFICCALCSAVSDYPLAECWRDCLVLGLHFHQLSRVSLRKSLHVVHVPHECLGDVVVLHLNMFAQCP